MRRFTYCSLASLLALATLAGCGVAPSHLAPSGAPATRDTSMAAARKAGLVEKDAVLVQLRDLTHAEAVARENGLTIGRQVSAIRLVELRGSGKQSGAAWLDTVLSKLKADARVSFAEPNLALKPKSFPSTDIADGLLKRKGADPLRPLQYSLDVMGVEKAWQTTMGDPQVVVAVIDSGVDAKHDDLKVNLSKDAYDAFTDKRGLDAAMPSALSRLGGKLAALGHGTHVAGIIGAEGGNKEGIVGVAPRCTLMPIKVFPSPSLKPDPRMGGEDPQDVIASVVARGIVYATDHGAQVINMSLGFPHESQAMAAAVEYALQKGVSVLVSAGNERMEGSPVNTLANLPGVIGVGATDEDDRITSFSNAGKYVSVSAPGFRVLSTMPSFFNGLVGKPYQYMDGTSMAAPNAAGVAALVKSAKTGLSPAQVKLILEQSADDQGPAGWDDSYGHGRVNAARAIELALKL